jgi:hypothetical protein
VTFVTGYSARMHQGDFRIEAHGEVHPPPGHQDVEDVDRVHITDGSPCWCDPERVEYEDGGG